MNMPHFSQHEVTNLARLRSQKRSEEEEDDGSDVFQAISDKRGVEANAAPANPYINSRGLTAAGKAALKANSIWTSSLTQLSTFQAGKQLSQELGEKLADKTGIDPIIGAKVAEAVMKQILEHVDEVATAEMEESFPDLFRRTRG